MRILIIGGTRFTGPYIVRSLVNLGNEIVLFHRGQSVSELPEDVRHIYGDRDDLDDYADELRKFEPELVLDMIARTERHAQSVIDIFKGIARRIIVISSQDVYRAYGRLIEIEPEPIEPIPISEDDPLRDKLYPYREKVRPDDQLYNYDKILVERICSSVPELPATILRYPMVYGPGDRQHRTFPYLKRMQDGRNYILMEKGLANWRWTRGYVENVAAAVVLAIINEAAVGRIYNVGEEFALTEAEWVQAIAPAANWHGRIIKADRENIPKHLLPDFNTSQSLVTDTTRIQEELGYKEIIAMHEALGRTVAWQLSNYPEKYDPEDFDYDAEDSFQKNLKKNG